MYKILWHPSSDNVNINWFSASEHNCLLIFNFQLRVVHFCLIPHKLHVCHPIDVVHFLLLMCGDASSEHLLFVEERGATVAPNRSMVGVECTYTPLVNACAFCDVITVTPSAAVRLFFARRRIWWEMRKGGSGGGGGGGERCCCL